MIFPDFKRTETHHRERNVTNYEFLNHSAWPICDFYRNYVNERTTAFIDDKEFVSRYKSANDYHHHSASFELLIHQFFVHQGFIVEKHPDLGVPGRADFKASNGPSEVILECTLAGSTLEEGTVRNRMEALESIVDAMHFFPYWINIKYKTVSIESVSARKLKSFINVKVKEIEHLEQEQQFHVWFEFENNGWQFEICLIKKTNPEIKRSLGFVKPLQRDQQDNHNVILTALDDKKPRKYNIGDRPYIICLNAAESFTATGPFQRALYGTSDGKYLHFNQSSQDCFFFREGKPVNTSVSGVFFFKNLSLFNLIDLEYSLWPNPFAKNPVPFKLLYTQMESIKRQNDEMMIERIPGKRDIFSLLGIDRGSYESMNSKQKQV